MRRNGHEDDVVADLLDAYRQGAFPMADPESGSLDFYTADPRGVIPLEGEGMRVSRSLARRLRSGRFCVRCDTAFLDVVRGCALPRVDDDQTWIDGRIAGLAQLLFDAGHAHSVEAWRVADGEEILVGGVYGVTLGGAFFGESMFSLPRERLADGGRDSLDGTDASKVCLAHLVEHLRERGYVLFDTQFSNPHIERLGCVEMCAGDYMERLGEAVGMDVDWGEFKASGRWKEGGGWV